MAQISLIFYMALTLLSLITKVDGNKLNEGELLAELLKGYNDQVRPVKNASDQVMVEVSFQYQQLLDLNEKEQVLSSIIILSTMWTDEYFKWNETETGIRRLVVPANLVWVPDLFISNLADEAKSTIEDLLGRRETAIFYPNGKVLHVRPFRVKTTCKLNMADFPFDRQYCAIQLGSWGYDQDQVDIKLLGKTRVDGYIAIDVASSDWTIVRITDKLMSVRCENTLISFKQHVIKVTVVLDRKSSMTVAYTICPCIMLDVIVSFSFLLPIRCGERISLGLTAFLAYSVYLLIIAEKLPEGSDVLPNLAVIFLVFMGTSLVSIIWSVIASHIDLEESKYRVPPKCLLMFAHLMNKCSKTPDTVAVVSYKKAVDQVSSTLSQDHSIDSLNVVVEGDTINSVDHSEDWNLIVKGIDKVFFIIVLLQLFISSGGFIAGTVHKAD